MKIEIMHIEEFADKDWAEFYGFWKNQLDIRCLNEKTIKGWIEKSVIFD